MKVSVIIPVYNTAAYLPTCLESLLAQTLSDWEALLVDDGSTDGSGALCREFVRRDSRFRLLGQAHKGVSAARNLALDAAAGEYLFFLDSDDAIHPRLLEVLVAQAEVSGSQLVFCRLVKQKEDRVEKALAAEDGGEQPRWTVSEDPDQVDRDRELAAIGGKLVSRGLVGPLRFREDVCHGEDTLFLYYLTCRRPRFSRTDRQWYYYRQHPDSLMTSITEMDYDQYGRIFRIIAQEEYAQGRLKSASQWQEKLCMVLTDRIFLAEEAGRKDVARTLRQWLREERRHPLYRQRSFVCKAAVSICLFCAPLFYLVKLTIRQLRRAAGWLQRR